MSNSKRYAKCPYLHPDCFARSSMHKGYCSILTDADFGERDCPFFKTLAQYSYGLVKYRREDDQI